MTKGIIYILTNLAMDGYVKIGKTTDLEQRIKDLDNTSVPLPFHCAYAAEVDNYDEIEKLMFDAFGDVRTRKRREFFEIDEERAIAALKLTGGKDVTPRDDVLEEGDEESAQASEKAARRKRFLFSMIGLKQGDEISFVKDEMIKAEVADDKNVFFEGQKMSVSEVTHKVLGRLGYNWKSVQGQAYWEYEGKTLNSIRLAMEEEGQEQE